MALIQQVKDGKFIDETTGTGSTSTKSSEKDKKTNELGYDQFLQILCAEMQYQDPLEPTSNTEYVAQLATFHRWKQHLVCRVQSRAAMQMHLLENMLLSRQHLRLEKQQQQRDLLITVQKENGETEDLCKWGVIFTF